MYSKIRNEENNNERKKQMFRTGGSFLSDNQQQQRKQLSVSIFLPELKHITELRMPKNTPNCWQLSQM